MSTTALLLIDFQNDYFAGGKWPLEGTEAAADKGSRLLAAFRENEMPVFHVRHEFPTTDAPFFHPGSEGAQIHQQLAPVESEPVIVKQYINSFQNTELKALMDAKSVEKVVIAGAMSHLCIDAVTRAAADFGYQCVVAHDACATLAVEFNGVSVPADHVHATLMAALGFAYAEVKSTTEIIQHVIQGYDNSTVINAVRKASSQWQAAFNAGDAAGCAAQYEQNAVMHARPFGVFNGIKGIQHFWDNLINDGYADVSYVNPRIEVVDDHSARLTADWTMNNASGVIHNELWVIQTDGTAKLREDDFEAK